MRGLHRAVLPLAILVAACGGGDLTLPGPGEPATLSIVSGDDQRGTVGELVSEPLVVQLLDGAGRPVRGATVLFRFSDDLPNAAVDPASPATDEAGRAAASARLGNLPGDQMIDAQVPGPGRDLQVRFRLTALGRNPPPGDGGGGGGGGGSAGPPPSGGDDGKGGGGGNGGGGGGNHDGNGGNDGGGGGDGGNGHGGHGQDKGGGDGRGHD
jgi:hypothetical protein